MSIGVCPTPLEAWLSLSQGATRHGYSRSTNFAAVAMAKCYAQRLIGSIRPACVDHIVVFGEQHLRHALLWYMNYYNEVRTHLSLGNLAPVSRVVHAIGRILPRPSLGGLHHEYVRI